MKIETAFEIVSRPVLAQVSPRPSATAPGLTPQELHAEAAALIDWCERNLQHEHMTYLRCRFGHDQTAAQALAQIFAGPWQLEHRRHGIAVLIETYCRRKGGIHKVRAALGCSMAMARHYRDLVYTSLDITHYQAMQIIAERELRSKLLVA